METCWQLVLDTAKSLGPDDLSREVTIRRQPYTVLQPSGYAVLPPHTGQIIFLSEHWTGAQWKTLSVPRGQSEQVNAAFAAKFQLR
jgi:hypothetical protein